MIQFAAPQANSGNKLYGSEYQGCFIDERDDRDFSLQYEHDEMTIEWCSKTCLQNGMLTS